MKTHRWLPHAVMPAVRCAPGQHSTGTARASAARGILILALVPGIGAVAAASSVHGGAGHADAHQPAGNIRLAASANTISSGHLSNRPWMY